MNLTERQEQELQRLLPQLLRIRDSTELQGIAEFVPALSDARSQIEQALGHRATTRPPITAEQLVNSFELG